MGLCESCKNNSCGYASEDVIRCGDFEENLVQTNADLIRATDDELVTVLHAVKLGYRPWCDYHCENEGDDGCDNCIKKWLKQPAEE